MGQRGGPAVRRAAAALLLAACASARPTWQSACEEKCGDRVASTSVNETQVVAVVTCSCRAIPREEFEAAAIQGVR